MKNNKYIVFDLSGTLASMRPARLLLSKKILLKLSKVYCFAIITGAKRTETLNILKKIGVIKLFPVDMIVTKDDTRLRKPNPRLFRILNCKKIIVYIGDTVNDARMAKDAGINFINIRDLLNII